MRRQLKLKGGGKIALKIYNLLRTECWPRLGCAQAADIVIDSLQNIIYFEGVIKKNRINSYYIDSIIGVFDDLLNQTMISRIDDNVLVYIHTFLTYLLDNNEILENCRTLTNRDDDIGIYKTYIYCLFVMGNEISEMLPQVALSVSQIHKVSSMHFILISPYSETLTM